MDQNVEYIAGRKYYVQNKERGYLGNSPLWWAQGGHGYTDDLSRAEQFTDEASAQMVKENPDKWARWPSVLIDQYAHRVFDSQNFHEIKEKMA